MPTEFDSFFGIAVYHSGQATPNPVSDGSAINIQGPPKPECFRLVWLSDSEKSILPSEGRSTVFIAKNKRSELHFRIFDEEGTLVVDKPECVCEGRLELIKSLRTQFGIEAHLPNNTNSVVKSAFDATRTHELGCLLIFLTLGMLLGLYWFSDGFSFLKKNEIAKYQSNLYIITKHKGTVVRKERSDAPLAVMGLMSFAIAVGGGVLASWCLFQIWKTISYTNEECWEQRWRTPVAGTNSPSA